MSTEHKRAITASMRAITASMRRIGRQENWGVSNISFERYEQLEGSHIVRAKFTHKGRVKWFNAMLPNLTPDKDFFRNAATQLREAFSE